MTKKELLRLRSRARREGRNYCWEHMEKGIDYVQACPSNLEIKRWAMNNPDKLPQEAKEAGERSQKDVPVEIGLILLRLKPLPDTKTKPVGWKKKKPRRQAKTKKEIAAKAFYASWEWKKLRFEILKKYGPVCMLCKSEDRIVVDHIKPRSRFPHLELDPDNMQVLCDDCNRGKSNDDYTDFRPAEGMLTDAEYDELKIVNEAREVMH